MPVTSANFSLTGWGVGSTVTFLQGTQRRCEITITAGTSPSLDPTVAFFFPDYIYPSAPICVVKQNSFKAANTGQFSDIVCNASTTSGKAVSFVYLGVPLAGMVYIFIIDTLGV